MLSLLHIPSSSSPRPPQDTRVVYALSRLQDEAAELRNWRLVRDVNLALGGDRAALRHCLQLWETFTFLGGR